MMAHSVQNKQHTGKDFFFQKTVFVFDGAFNSLTYIKELHIFTP